MNELNSSFILHPSSFNANNLLQFRDDFDQIGLISHHLFDVFVCAGDFVNYAFVFAAFDTAGLAFQILAGELLFRFGARHFAPRAV